MCSPIRDRYRPLLSACLPASLGLLEDTRIKIHRRSEVLPGQFALFYIQSSHIYKIYVSI